MQVFSKMLDRYDNIADEKRLVYEHYIKDKNTIKTYKLDKLKKIAKLYKLHVSGKKQNLIQRIEEHFIKLNCVIKIQSTFRRYLNNKIIALRGPAFKKKSLCVNDTDFYTLEPICNIHHSNFFSYVDASGFIYGFELNSLITMLRKQGTIINPYNRNKIDFHMIKTIKHLDKLTKTIYNKDYKPYSIENSRNNAAINYSTQRENILLKMNNIRNKDSSTRINELFIEIDLLGNYTQSSWFSNLEKTQYLKFILNLYEIWNYSSNMSLITRHNICPYFNPFIDGGLDNIYAIRNLFINNGINYSREDLQKHALTIMENIIYTGNDIEYRKIGILHVLRALTLVSIPARISLPWLYESIEY